ncbi:MAG: hypothetical protein ACRBN8_20360 [Nannocystales bacterium]
MTQRKPLHTLCALFGLAMACQPGTVETSADIDEDVVLTSDDPVAAFEVTLCISEGSPNGLNMYSSFHATTSTNEGEVAVTLETLDPGEESGTSSSYVEVTNATTTATESDVSLNTQRDWEASGERCQEQVVQVSVESLPEGQTVTVTDIHIDLLAEWAGLCDSPDEDSLSIETVRL